MIPNFTFSISRALALGLLGASLGLPFAGVAQTTAGIQGETQRQTQREQRLVSLWWLPAEYWQAAARETGRGESEIERAGVLTRSYVILVGWDAEISRTGEIQARSHEEMAESVELVRDGAAVQPLRGRANPELSNALSELSYVLRVAQGPLGKDLRIFLFPNLAPEGTPLDRADRAGVVRARYRLGGTGSEVLDFEWRTPLTALTGPKACPKEGEALEAHWAYCPWHGVEAP